MYTIPCAQAGKKLVIVLYNHCIHKSLIYCIKCTGFSRLFDDCELEGYHSVCDGEHDRTSWTLYSECL